MKHAVKKYFLILYFVGYLSAVKFRCDYSYIKVGWVKYHEIPSTWSDARLRCKSEGGMLASPTSHELVEALKEAAQHNDIFTGIHATLSPGSYYTIDGIPLAEIYHTWADKEPDNKYNSEMCISINADGKLSDVSCYTPRPYMCYRMHSLKTTNVCGTPDPEYRFEPRTNKCYKFHTSRRTFERAHLVCSAEGGHLAIINSETESQVIRDLFAQYPAAKIHGLENKDAAFIGFHNYGESQDWTTVRGQTLEEAGFAGFAEHQPDNATTGEYCGSVFRNGLLNDLWCDAHFPFICEKDTTSPPVCDTNVFN